MILYHKHYAGPPGSPLLVLHGLYGNQGNWAPQARELARDHDVFVLDARNHGLSAWAPSLRLQDMADDVADTMDSLGLARAHLVGHSMGGKTAMLLALTRPQRVCSVCSVDIAPVRYPQAATTVIDALVGLDLASVASRSDADRQLSTRIAEKSVRDFLLTNLLRQKAGTGAGASISRYWRRHSRKSRAGRTAWVSMPGPVSSSRDSAPTTSCRSMNPRYLRSSRRPGWRWWRRPDTGCTVSAPKRYCSTSGSSSPRCRRADRRQRAVTHQPGPASPQQAVPPMAYCSRQFLENCWRRKSIWSTRMRLLLTSARYSAGLGS